MKHESFCDRRIRLSEPNGPKVLGSCACNGREYYAGDHAGWQTPWELLEARARTGSIAAAKKARKA